MKEGRIKKGRGKLSDKWFIVLDLSINGTDFPHDAMDTRQGMKCDHVAPFFSS